MSMMLNQASAPGTPCEGPPPAKWSPARTYAIASQEIGAAIAFVCAPSQSPVCASARHVDQTHLRVALTAGHRAAPQSRSVRRRPNQHLEDLPGGGNPVVSDMLSDQNHLDARIKENDQHTEQDAKQDTQACQLTQPGGVGSVAASAIWERRGKGHDSSRGRQFCAWRGLVPIQYCSSSKGQLGCFTKAGYGYLRTLLVT
jgi:transposase